MAMVNVVTIAAYRRIYWLMLIGLVQRSAATWRCVLYSSDEPGELLQWQCHDDSTVNTVVASPTTMITVAAKYLLCSCIKWKAE